MITIPVRQITQSTPRTRILNLDVRAAEFSFSAGQAVMLGLSGSPLRKPYSIASAPWEVEKSGIMQLLVQIDSGGLDPHVELATPVTPLDLEGPFGSFGLPADIDRPMLFIAGGTGIAPLRSMLIEHLSRPTSHRVDRARSGTTHHRLFHDHARRAGRLDRPARPHQRGAVEGSAAVSRQRVSRLRPAAARHRRD